MANICKVTLNNIEKCYNDLNGNLYFRVTEELESDYQLIDSFELDELKAAIGYGDIEVIYVSITAQALIENLLIEKEVLCA